MKKIFCILLFVFLLVAYNSVKAESTCPFDQELTLGSENSDVKELQTFMSEILKIYSGPITGYFGPLTMSSVKVFQESSGLLQTGKVDLITANALCKLYLSYKTGQPLSTQSGECFLKTLGIQRGYSEEANEEVKNLQIYLNQKGYYPENIISGYFGVKTELALKAFQKANNISQSGIVDDITFKTICGYESDQSSYCPFVTENLSVGYFEEANNEVKMLQMVLNKLSLIEEKNVTGYFGKITEEAVKAMQVKASLTPTGVLDLKTREVLCKMINLPMKNGSTNPYESSSSNIDVTISGITISPETIDVNTKTAIVIKIKNIGSEDTKLIKSSLYVNDKEINKTSVNPIKPNDEVIAIVQNWTCEQKGIYALKVFIDSDNELVEKNKYNNVLVVPVNCGEVKQSDYKYTCNTVTQKCEIDNTNGKLLLSECQSQCVADSNLPDLTIEQFKADKTILNPNESTNITIVEKNIGKSTADYHKANLIINGNNNETDWGPLDAGSKNTISQVTFTCVAPGVYNLKIVTDSNNAIKEADEENNFKLLEIKCKDEKGNIPSSGSSGSGGSGSGSGDSGDGGNADQGSGSQDSDGNKSKTGTGKTNLGNDTGSVASGGLKLSWFSVTPNDCYNCPQKRCGVNNGRSQSCGGGFTFTKNKYGVNVITSCPGSSCVDSRGNSLPFYRESPHKMRVTYNIYNFNNLYKPNMTTNCEIDLGDGTKHDCTFTGFYYNGKDVTGENNEYIEFYHSFVNTTDKPITVCPSITIVDPNLGDKIVAKLNNAFCDSTCNEGQEDTTKCLVIYPEGWSFQTKDKDGNQNAYNVGSFTASPNPGKVNETITFTYSNTGMKPENVAWCKIDFGDGAKETFECKQQGTVTHVYKYPKTYAVTMSVDESIDFLSCDSKPLTLVIQDSDGKEPDKEPTKKYSCVNKQCVLDEKGIYDDPKCKGKCETTDIEKETPSSCNNDWCYVCNPSLSLTSQCMFLNKSDYLKDEYKTLKRFEYILDCRSKNSPCFSKYECDTTSKTCKIVSKDKTGSEIYEDYGVCSEKCGALNYPNVPYTTVTKSTVDTKVQNPSTWFTNLISGIFDNKSNLSVTPSITVEKKYNCTNGVCKESQDGKGVSLDQCMSKCLSVSNLFESLNLSSSSFATTTTKASSLNFSSSSFDFYSSSYSKRYDCDIKTGKCAETPNGVYTSEGSCLSKCGSLNSITSSSLNFSALNLSSQLQTQATRYKCNSKTKKCEEATNIDTNTYSDKNKCQTECDKSINVSPSFNFTDFNLQFNQ